VEEERPATQRVVVPSRLGSGGTRLFRSDPSARSFGQAVRWAHLSLDETLHRSKSGGGRGATPFSSHVWCRRYSTISFIHFLQGHFNITSVDGRSKRQVRNRMKTSGCSTLELHGNICRPILT
jgi:hypothetical protein